MTANNFQASEHQLRHDDEMPSLSVSDTNPLAFWRMLPSDAFDHASVGKLRTALLNTSLLREPRWSDAVRGDPISAIGIAARLLPVKSVTPLIDMVMSALCLNALRGNGGCVLVLSHVLNALGRQNPEFKKIGISWLARDLASRLSRGERSRDPVRCPAAKERP